MWSSLWGRWIRWVSAGEFAGFAVPAVIGATLASAPTEVFVAALIAAGAVEGAVLGWAQAHVLRRVFADIAAGAWVARTAAAAALAWGLGLELSSLAGHLGTWSLWLTVPAVVVLGSALLISLGWAQWTVLRRHVERAWWWIWITAGAWAAGLLVFAAVTSPLWQPGQPTALVVAIGALGGLAMALTMAAASGAGLTWLARNGSRVLQGRRRTGPP